MRELPVSRSELEEHNTESDGWISVDGVVLDMSRYGGAFASTVATVLGRDITDQYFELFGDRPSILLSKYAIALLAPAAAQHLDGMEEAQRCFDFLLPSDLTTVGGRRVRFGELSAYYGDDENDSEQEDMGSDQSPAKKSPVAASGSGSCDSEAEAGRQKGGAGCDSDPASAADGPALSPASAFMDELSEETPSRSGPQALAGMRVGDIPSECPLDLTLRIGPATATWMPEPVGYDDETGAELQLHVVLQNGTTAEKQQKIVDAVNHAVVAFEGKVGEGSMNATVRAAAGTAADGLTRSVRVSMVPRGKRMEPPFCVGLRQMEEAMGPFPESIWSGLAGLFELQIKASRSLDDLASCSVAEALETGIAIGARANLRDKTVVDFVGAAKKKAARSIAALAPSASAGLLKYSSVSNREVVPSRLDPHGEWARGAWGIRIFRAISGVLGSELVVDAKSARCIAQAVLPAEQEIPDGLQPGGEAKRLLAHQLGKVCEGSVGLKEIAREIRGAIREIDSVSRIEALTVRVRSIGIGVSGKGLGLGVLPSWAEIRDTVGW